MKLTIRSYGQTEVDVDEAEYRQAIADGQIDQLLDPWASDIDEDTEIVEPDGTVRCFNTGDIIQRARGILSDGAGDNEQHNS